jgi:hypothetical protein
MFGLFKKKTEKEKLNAQYNKLIKEGYELSKINRTASDRKYTEADAVQKKIDSLDN